MTNRLKRGMFVLVGGLVFCAIPSTAGAHAGNDDPALLHVCIGNVSKVVRSVGVSGACIPGPRLVAETADHWRKEGEKGEKGDKGDNGTNGTNGMDGTSVAFVGNFSGNQNGCANGGAIYTAGNPPVHAYVCNGTNGIDGQGGTGVRADGPCFDDVNRYVDCGNGTVTDTVMGLIWLQDAACLGSLNWAAANQAAAALKEGDCGLTDGSSPGDWRLATKDEWTWTAQPTCRGFLAPSWTDDAGTARYSAGGSSFAGVLAESYWSSTSDRDFPIVAWVANLLTSNVESVIQHNTSINGKNAPHRVWPVRGGTR